MGTSIIKISSQHVAGSSIVTPENDRMLAATSALFATRFAEGIPACSVAAVGGVPSCEDNSHGRLRNARRYDLVDVEHFECYEHLASSVDQCRFNQMTSGWLPSKSASAKPTVICAPRCFIPSKPHAIGHFL